MKDILMIGLARFVECILRDPDLTLRKLIQVHQAAEEIKKSKLNNS